MINCIIADCRNQAGVPGTAQGLCRAHYKRLIRYGSPNEPSRRVTSWKGDACAETGCDKKIVGHGLCMNHSAKAKRRADPEGQRRRTKAFKTRLQQHREQLLGRVRPSLCELCHTTGIGRGNKITAGICFDHDHATGKPRGWLCDRCNKVLGLMGDSADLMRKLAAYLEFHHGQTYVSASPLSAEKRVCATESQDRERHGIIPN